MKKFSISICFAFAFFWGYSQIIPVTLYTTKDAYTISTVMTNYGNDVQMEAGIFVNKFGTATFRRSYTEIALTGIPPEAIIISAQLKVYQNSGLTAATTSDLLVQRLTSSWDEAIIKYGTEPNDSPDEIVTTSSYSNNWRSFDVKTHVQKMVNGSYANLGWRISYYNETQTTANVYKFQTSDGANAPKLEISYYLPLKIDNVVYNHCLSTSSTDGTITPTFSLGCGSTYTYEWYDSSGLISGATSSSINGRTYGWYGLHAYNTANNDHLYMAFILGVNCSNASINFNPGPNFIDDAPIANGIPLVGTPPYVTTNYGSSTSLLSQTSTSVSVIKYTNFVRFKLWMDPNISITQADMSLVGKTHSSGGLNAATLSKVTSQWTENVVTWNNSPTSDATITTNIPETISTTESKTVSILNFWNYWKTNNNSNFGMKLLLQSSTSTTRRMEFHSSDAASGSRPSIQFSVSVNNLLSGTITAGSTSICSGSTTLLTLSGYTAGSTFQWESSSTDSGYLPISGATSSTYTTLSSTTLNKYYRCVVSKGACTPVIAYRVLITIKPVPTITVNNPSFCSGNTVTLTATPSIGGGTYLWSTGGTTASIAVAPLVNTNYTVVYTLNGCSSTMQTSSVTVCQQFAKLERILTGINYNVFAENVNFFFDQEYTSSNTNLTYKIFKVNDRTSPVMTGISNVKIVVFADNRYKLNVASLTAGIYILEVKNDKNELFYLRFTK